MYTTEPEEKRQLEIAGCGVGLPLSRLYCEYFGGSLEVTSSGEDGATFRARLGHGKDSQERAGFGAGEGNLGDPYGAS